MAIKHKIYSSVVWHNVWDPAVSKTWLEFHLENYTRKWPDIEKEDIPVATEGAGEISSFTLSGLPYIILEKVDSMEGLKKIRTICEYGIKDWSGLMDENGMEIKPSFVKDENGLQKLSQQSWEFLNFFGFPDLPMTSMLAVQIMKISRYLRH